MGLRSRIVDWMSSRHALPAVFVASLLEMTVVPIPLEVALVPVMLASPERRWLAATSAWLGCLVGAALWYALGYFAFDAVEPVAVDLFGGQGQMAAYQQDLRERGWIFVFLAGVTPVPFQIACVLAGLIRFALPPFFLAAGAARFVRYFGLAAAVALFGDRTRTFMLERPWALAGLLVLVAAILLGIGTVIEYATNA